MLKLRRVRETNAHEIDIATERMTVATKKKATAAKKTTPAKKKQPRKYSPGASDYVHEEMHEMEAGKLRSGRSGKKVTDPKQAIAIGLSEARRHGEKVPKRT
jgi:hypothetical protein